MAWNVWQRSLFDQAVPGCVLEEGNEQNRVQAPFPGRNSLRSLTGTFP